MAREVRDVTQPWVCPICFEAVDGDNGDVVSIACADEHRFCRLCLLQHVDSQPFPRCPAVRCAYELSEQDLIVICGAGSQRVERFREDLLTKAVDQLSEVVRCPNPDCSCALTVDGGRQRWQCCEWPAWCTKCRQPYHYKVECEAVEGLCKRWLQWVSTDRSTYHQEEVQHSRFETQRIALEEALSRHAELQRDEEWKRANCRECPRCQRVVEKLEGCDQMICGQDAHGGNRQNGCGHHFSWNEARAYRVAPESRPLPQLNVEEVRLRGANLRHPFTHCSSCEQDIVGPRFRCIHCPDYNLCVTCERECATCATHPLNHVFEILFKADYDLRAHLPLGSHVLIADHSERHGFEAILEHEICQDVFQVRLLSDNSERQLHRSAVQVKLETSKAVEAHVKAHVAAQVAEAQQVAAKRQQAVSQMRGTDCVVG